MIFCIFTMKLIIIVMGAVITAITIITLFFEWGLFVCLNFLVKQFTSEDNTCADAE